MVSMLTSSAIDRRFETQLGVLDQDALLDFDSASLLKQQSANRHAAPLVHIILIPSQPVYALSS
jgi:hypothetical protein